MLAVMCRPLWCRNDEDGWVNDRERTKGMDDNILPFFGGCMVVLELDACEQLYASCWCTFTCQKVEQFCISTKQQCHQNSADFVLFVRHCANQLHVPDRSIEHLTHIFDPSACLTSEIECHDDYLDVTSSFGRIDTFSSLFHAENKNNER
jgi:hypothetical protein